MRALIAVILFAVALPAGAQLYRWTDKSGKEQFSDTPPPPGAKNVKRLKPAAGGGGASDTASMPYALQQAMSSAPVTLYTTPGCDACVEARKLLNGRGIPFKEVSVNSEAQLAELKNAVGSNSVPAMIVGGDVLKGFEEGRYHSALDSAGYPRAGILRPRDQAEPGPESAAPPSGAAAPADAPSGRQPGPYAPR